MRIPTPVEKYSAVGFRASTKIGLVALLILALAASVVHAVIPGEVNYQGLLLDDLGAPINGTRDFDFNLFTVDTGGAAVWTESHNTVSIVDGVYDIALGSVTPIPTSVLSGGTLYLEIAVDTETLSPRQRLLAVPYALRSAVSEETENVAGIESAYFEAILVAAPWDGTPPDNFDPSEGLVDVDADGLPNFMDSDNDGDGIPDGIEVVAGDDINLTTPTITGIFPSKIRDDQPASLTVSGTNFSSSMTVQIGAEIGVVSNVTATSADVAVGAHPAAFEDVIVSLTNGQDATLVSGIEFFVFAPTITSVEPGLLPENTPTSLTISGMNFEPTMSVQVGAETGVLSNVTATSADVAIGGGHSAGQENVTVTLANSASDVLLNAVTFVGPRVIFVTSTTQNGNLGGISGADAICAARATAGGLSGTYQAWISDDVDSPSTRSTQPVGVVYANTQGAVVAGSWPALTDGNLDSGIIGDENGASVTVGSNVWTNVSDLGAASAGSSHCSGWTSTSGNGGVGLAGLTNSSWTNAGTSACIAALRLYCIEQ